MAIFRRKNPHVEARQHEGARITVDSRLKGKQNASSGDYLVTDPEAPEPKGSIYVVPKADFEREHELDDSPLSSSPLVDQIKASNTAFALLLTASEALQSYENGNSSPDLAREIRGEIEAFLHPPTEAEEAHTE